MRSGHSDRGSGPHRVHLMTFAEARDEDEAESADETLTISMNQFPSIADHTTSRPESEGASSSTEEHVGSSTDTGTSEYVYSELDYPDDGSGADSTASTEDYLEYDYSKWNDYKDQEHSPSRPSPSSRRPRLPSPTLRPPLTPSCTTHFLSRST